LFVTKTIVQHVCAISATAPGIRSRQNQGIWNKNLDRPYRYFWACTVSINTRQKEPQPREPGVSFNMISSSQDQFENWYYFT
jgi:hypothetical protein